MSWLLLNWKLVVIGVLCAALAGMTNLYLGKRDQLVAFKTQVEDLGKAAVIEKDRIEAQGVANLAKIKEDHEAKVPQIRAGAVAAYLAAHPSVRKQPAGSGVVPSPSPDQQVDDDIVCQPVLDEAIIESAAEDAAKLEAWQDYAILNGIQVTP